MRFLYAALACAPLASAIWPIPSKFTSGNTTLWINNNVAVSYTNAHANHGGNQSWPPSSDQIVRHGIQRAYETLFSKNFIPWKFHARNSDFEPSPSNKKFIKKITLEQTAADPSNFLKPLDGGVSEKYTLCVTESGDVTITAASSIGLLHGLTTFTQLFYKHSNGDVYTPLAPVNITDEPKFSHRGLNMDISRNWFEVSDIKRVIDAMAYNKFNRFHLHATDSQSWPLEIPALPELAKKGAYASHLTYSPQDLRDIQAYGAMLGVEVIIEIDMPGHTASIWHAYPDLITAYNQQPDWDTYANEPPSGNLKLNDSNVDAFLDKLLGDLLPRVKPYSAYFHTGGDEINKNAYLLQESLRTNDSEVLKPLMQKFVDKNHDRVRAAGLTPIVWEEMVLPETAPLSWGLTLGKDVIVQTWQSDEAVENVTSAGYKALVGNNLYWYLDCGRGQWINFQGGTQMWKDKYALGFADYCSPTKNWRWMYAYDPLQGVSAKNHHLVVGGECHIWAEMTDPINLDRMVWPRASAAAEILWSGAKDEHGRNRSQIEAAPRLSEMRERLVARGVMAEPIQMIFCLQGDNQCSL